MSHPVFDLLSFRRHFFDAAAEIVVPSPVGLVLGLKDRMIAHIQYVQAEQEAFQQRLNAVGIECISRLTTRDVLEMYGCR